MTVGEFAEAVFAYCQELNASELAGYLTEAENHRRGGSPTSSHRYALARDVTYDQRPSLASAITTASRLELDILRLDNHDHLQPRGWLDELNTLRA